MPQSAVPEQDPTSLPPGTRIGPWRVVGWRGRGSYGVVYRAVRAGREEEGSVALKLALQPEDPRFEREANLLSRLRHPNVPRLLDRGEWRHPSGAHPYLVMEWVQGGPLYDWASVRNPTSRQVFRVLAQVARALEAVHAAKAVHRDVKGGNVLVRPADGRAVLTDFGSGNYAGASPLTQRMLPPSTPQYLSPEAWRFVMQFCHDPSARYAATPADDLFALGVTAYRLVTEEYPPSTEPEVDRAGIWRLDGEGPRPPALINYRVDLRLNAIILRLLSARPEDRGTGGALASELEQAAEDAGPEADHPLFMVETRASSSLHAGNASLAELHKQSLRRRDVQALRLSAQHDAAEKAELERAEAEELARAEARIERAPSRAPARPWRFLDLAIAAGALLMVATWRVEPQRSVEVPRAVQGGAHAADRKDRDTATLGDEALKAASAEPKSEKHSGGIRLEVPPNPLKGQRRAPCPRGDVEIRGGCWAELKSKVPDCQKYAYEWNGGCYVPVFPSRPPATSDSP